MESLLRRKDDVEHMIRQERNRQHALVGRPHVAAAVSNTIDRVLAALSETLLAIEEAIAEHLRAHTTLHEDAKRLRSVPGIGAKNVAYILVLLHRWMTLTAGEGTQKGLAAYIGLDPQTYESGTSVRRRAVISRMGDQAVRRRLAWRRLLQRLVGQGKPKMSADRRRPQAPHLPPPPGAVRRRADRPGGVRRPQHRREGLCMRRLRRGLTWMRESTAHVLPLDHREKNFCAKIFTYQTGTSVGGER